MWRLESEYLTPNVPTLTLHKPLAGSVSVPELDREVQELERFLNWLGFFPMSNQKPLAWTRDGYAVSLSMSFHPELALRGQGVSGLLLLHQLHTLGHPFSCSWRKRGSFWLRSRCDDGDGGMPWECLPNGNLKSCRVLSFSLGFRSFMKDWH